MIKRILLNSVIILLLIGCLDKKEDTSEQLSQKIITQEPLKIEVEKNINAKEIKVIPKEKISKENEQYYFNYNIKSKYDPNAKPANEDAAVRIRPRTTIEANMQIRSSYEKVKISLLVKRLSKEFIVKCSACHNDYANGIIGPSLLTRDSDYIFNKLMTFKRDPKANVLMTGLVKQMQDKEIRKLANEIFEFNKQIRDLK